MTAVKKHMTIALLLPIHPYTASQFEEMQFSSWFGTFFCLQLLPCLFILIKLKILQPIVSHVDHQVKCRNGLWRQLQQENVFRSQKSREMIITTVYHTHHYNNNNPTIDINRIHLYNWNSEEVFFPTLLSAMWLFLELKSEVRKSHSVQISFPKWENNKLYCT